MVARAVITVLFVAGSLWAAAPPQQLPPAPKPLQVQVAPTPVTDTNPSEVSCKVTAVENDIASGNLAVYPPLGFSADPQTLTIPALKKGQNVVRRSTLKATKSTWPSGPERVSVELSTTTDATKTPALVGTESQDFVYNNTCISPQFYLVYGVLGIVVGYIVRYLVNLLKKSTPKQRALAANDQPTIPEEYFYLIDGAVTVVLGFLVLASMIKLGWPPEQACSWYGAVLVGVALGFLTNSDLMTKLPGR